MSMAAQEAMQLWHAPLQVFRASLRQSRKLFVSHAQPKTNLLKL
jgi:hypothetical protein